MLILRLGQQIDGPSRLHHQLDMLRLEIQALVAFLVVAEELVNNLLEADFEQELVGFDLLEDGQITHSLNHTLDIAVVLEVQIEAEVAHEATIVANFLLNRIRLLCHQQLVLLELANGCDAGHEEAGTLDQLPLMLLLTVFFFGYLHELDDDIDQVLVVVIDELSRTLIVVLHDEGQGEEKQIDVLRVEVHHPVILLLVLAVGAAIAIVAVILKIVRILVDDCRFTLMLGLVLLVTAVLVIGLQLFFLLLLLLDEIV